MPVSASRWRDARVDAIVRQSPDAVSIFLKADLPPHLPGQHVDLRLVAEDGYEARRSYSIASAPQAPRIELLVERLDHGEVSPFLHDVLRVGDTLALRGPLGGHFVWQGEAPGPLLLIAGSSGIAPLMAMLRHRAAVHPALPTLLLYSGRSWAELAFADELQTRAARDAAFRLVVTTTRRAARRAGDYGRRVDDAMLAELLGGWPAVPQQCFVCGSTGFVEAATAALVNAGIAPAVIRAERYGGV